MGHECARVANIADTRGINYLACQIADGDFAGVNGRDPVADPVDLTRATIRSSRPDTTVATTHGRQRGRSRRRNGRDSTRYPFNRLRWVELG